MQFGAMYLEAWRRRQPRVAFWTLEFLSCCFVCSGQRTAPSSLPFQALVFVVLRQVELAGGWSLSYLPCGPSSTPPRILY